MPPSLRRTTRALAPIISTFVGAISPLANAGPESETFAFGTRAITLPFRSVAVTPANRKCTSLPSFDLSRTPSPKSIWTSFSSALICASKLDMNKPRDTPVPLMICQTNTPPTMTITPRTAAPIRNAIFAGRLINPTPLRPPQAEAAP